MKHKVLEEEKQQRNSSRWQVIIGTVLTAVFALLIFLTSIDLLGLSFNRLGNEVAASVLTATSNPFLGLFIGLLVTAIIQSSSTSTSMVVALVASGSINFSDAVPIIMGANIGTTLTSTLVSLGYITRKKEFRKAVAAGTVHDFFNILLVILLFPLEYYFNLLSNSAQWISDSFSKNYFQDFLPNFKFDQYIMRDITSAISEAIPNSLLLLLISTITLFFSLKALSRLIYKIIIGQSQEKLGQFVFKNPLKSLAWGAVFTAAVQSSSVTTSLMVPIVATGKVSLKKAFPFIMGINLGTTITALLAAILKSEAAFSIAIAHLLFNLVGIAIFLPFPFLRKIPVFLAARLGEITSQRRIIGFLYIIFTFFLLPFLLIYLNQ